MTSKERRRSPRTPIKLLVQYRFDNFEDFLAEYSADLSKNGIFIRTDKPRAVGTFVHLQLTLRDGSRIIEGLGRVARACLPGDPDKTPGMGIEFLNLDDESAALIEMIISRAFQGASNKIER